MHRILVINPGSTSTKISVFHDHEEVFHSDIKHTTEEISKFKKIIDQLGFRRQVILEELRRNNISLDFDIIAGRGGLARIVKSGTYEVNDQMIDEELHFNLKHPCDLACIIAKSIADKIPGCRCFTSDPGTTDELAPEARITGSPLLPHHCIWHALNQKAEARRYAAEHGMRYEDLNLIICHMGGGISIAAHQKGMAIDVNNALDGASPFSTERAGTLPTSDLVKLCYSGKFTEAEMLKNVWGHGGIYAHLGTNNILEVIKRIESGDRHAKLVLDAMIWQTAKGITSEAAVLCGPPDAIILTGGMVKAPYIVNGIKRRVEWLAPVTVYPGQIEMYALAENALRKVEAEEKRFVDTPATLQYSKCGNIK